MSNCLPQLIAGTALPSVAPERILVTRQAAERLGRRLNLLRRQELAPATVNLGAKTHLAQGFRWAE